MKLLITPTLIKNINLFEKVLNGDSASSVAKIHGISTSSLRTGFMQLYKAIKAKEHLHLEVKKTITEQNKFDLFTMKINRAYWLHQLKFLKQNIGIKEEQNE